MPQACRNRVHAFGPVAADMDGRKWKPSRSRDPLFGFTESCWALGIYFIWPCRDARYLVLVKTVIVTNKILLE